LDASVEESSAQRSFQFGSFAKIIACGVEVVNRLRKECNAGKKVLFFATLHYWIEQSAYLGLVLAGLGHDVTLLTLPYSEWHKQKDKFTQRQRVLHTHDALASLSPLVNMFRCWICNLHRLLRITPCMQ
jgi:hypothetical protein